MRWLIALAWAALWPVLPCRHREIDGTSLMYRERRTLGEDGPEILHLVCARCGHGQPALSRTPEEHQRIVRHRPAAERLTARRAAKATVVAIKTRRGRS